MAEVVLGFGSSHGPMLGPLETWPKFTPEDVKRDPRTDFDWLVEHAPPGLEAEITPEKTLKRYAAVRAAMKALREVATQADPDVIVVVGNRHGNAPYNQMRQVFGMLLSAEPTGPDALMRPRFESPPARSANALEHSTGGESARGARGRGSSSDVGREFCPTDPELAEHVFGALLDDGIDIACEFLDSDGDVQLEGDHAWVDVYRYLPDDSQVPIVPVLINRDPPSLASPKRCYELGKALRRAIEGWKSDKKVAVMSSGGLSHTVLDEELDRRVVEALVAKDTEALYSVPRDRLLHAGGTPEILNWVAMAGVMEPTPMTLIDYVPCYRTVLSNGHGMTFSYWK